MAAKEIIEYIFKGNPTELLNATKKVRQGVKGVGDESDRAAAQVNQSFSRMASGLQKAGEKMQRTGQRLTAGVTLPLAYALKRAGDEALQEQRSLMKLDSALKRTTDATAEQRKAVHDYIGEAEVAYAIADEDLRPAFERLARTTGDVDLAQRQLNIAVDASRATGRDLTTITEAMMKANMGQVGALGRLGLATRNANGDIMSMSEVMDVMERQFRGAADDYMDSAAGQAELAAISFGNLQEKIGEDLVPIMQDLSEIITKVSDFFRELPDPVQKAVVALLLLKGPAIWLGGAGAKLIGAWIAKIGALKAASATAQAAAATQAAAMQNIGPMFAQPMAMVSKETDKATQSLKRMTTIGRSVAGLGIFAAIAVSVERSIDGFSKWSKAYSDAEGTVLERAQSGSDAWSSTWTRAQDRIGRYLIPGMGAVADAHREAFDPENSNEFLDLLEKAEKKGGMYAEKAREIADSNISAKDGVQQLNDVLKMSPAQIDPVVAEMEALAAATGISAENMEVLKAEFEQLEAYFDYEAAIRAAQQGVEEFAKLLTEMRSGESDGGNNVTLDELRELEVAAEDAAKALAQKLQISMEQGKISAGEAAAEISRWQDQMVELTKKAPEASGKVNEINVELDKIKSRYIEIEVNTANAQKSIDQFVSMINRIPQRTLTFDRWLAGELRPPRSGNENERGGTIPFARGGVYMANSGGGITTGPMAVIGEGREPREYVIPTDPRFRDRATALMNQAAAELGVGAARPMSTFTANINVTGGSDPQATAAAVADAVEQAFARKKRREGSLAFT